MNMDFMHLMGQPHGVVGVVLIPRGQRRLRL